MNSVGKLSFALDQSSHVLIVFENTLQRQREVYLTNILHDSNQIVSQDLWSNS